MKIPNYLLVIALVLLQTGCSIGKPTRPSEFYVLSADPGSPVSGRTSGSAPLSVGLGPVILPEIYDRPQIVTRTDASQINLSEFDRWGSDLNKDLSRVLGQNLMGRLNTDSIVLYPWPGRHKPDFQVTILFFRLDGQLGVNAQLNGIWRLLDGQKACEIAAHRFSITEPTTGSGYLDFVNAINRGIAALSQEIAKQVAMTKPGC